MKRMGQIIFYSVKSMHIILFYDVLVLQKNMDDILVKSGNIDF